MEEIRIEKVDDLFVPCVVGDDSDQPGRITYFATGYPTKAEAEECIRAVEAGFSNPCGVPVDFNTGRRYLTKTGRRRVTKGA